MNVKIIAYSIGKEAINPSKQNFQNFFLALLLTMWVRNLLPLCNIRRRRYRLCSFVKKHVRCSTRRPGGSSRVHFSLFITTPIVSNGVYFSATTACQALVSSQDCRRMRSPTPKFKMTGSSFVVRSREITIRGGIPSYACVATVSTRSRAFAIDALI